MRRYDENPITDQVHSKGKKRICNRDTESRGDKSPHKVHQVTCGSDNNKRRSTTKIISSRGMWTADQFRLTIP